MSRAGTDIVIVGAGRMGRGIALAFAYAGHAANLLDSEEHPAGEFSALVESVMGELAGELEFLQKAGVISAAQAAAIQQRVVVSPKNAGAQILSKAAYCFEAVTEVLDIKKSTYAWVDKHVSPAAIVSSTTSTMSPDTLAGFLTDGRRFCNAHWLNPAYLMPLVEVCPAGQTSDETVVGLKATLENIGKAPVVCKSSPGFIVSRIQALVLNEAARLVEEGVATPEDIDKAIRVGFGVRYANLGALEFIDWGGGDILYHASEYLAGEIDHHRFAPPQIVRLNMKNGRNGLRDGQGFYDYREVDIETYRTTRLTGFVRLLQHLELMPKAAE